jgi:hypothetical protein
MIAQRDRRRVAGSSGPSLIVKWTLGGNPLLAVLLIRNASSGLDGEYRWHKKTPSDCAQSFPGSSFCRTRISGAATAS